VQIREEDSSRKQAEMRFSRHEREPSLFGTNIKQAQSFLKEESMTVQSPVFTTPGSVKHDATRLGFDSRMRQGESGIKGAETGYTYIFSPEERRRDERKEEAKK
jgi:hypothetical protein